MGLVVTHHELVSHTPLKREVPRESNGSSLQGAVSSPYLPEIKGIKLVQWEIQQMWTKGTTQLALNIGRDPAGH